MVDGEIAGDQDYLYAIASASVTESIQTAYDLVDHFDWVGEGEPA
jgi:hypothetical protein